MDVLTPAQRHKNMARIRSRDTKTEVMLRHALWHRGVRYRKNYAALPGSPDIAITKYKIAVFCDGDFWHGRELHRLESRCGANRDYWMKKLRRNMERDRENNDALTELGWLVLRFWEKDIRRDTEGCVRQIAEYLP